MREARLNRRLLQASADSPDVAACPACRGEVRKRRRKNGKGYTYFYRHKTAVGEGCPLRYRPTT